MNERDKKNRTMSTEGESVNWDHDKQKTEAAQNVAVDPQDFHKKLKVSDIVDISTTEFKIVKTKLTFVDKSEGIKRFFECEEPVVQITAPRRFGKSTFMNMLKIFLKITVDEDAKPIQSSDNYNMFMNLKLGQNHGDFVKEHCGQYPVIFMNLRYVGGESESDILYSLMNVIWQAFETHRYLLETAPDGSRSFKNKEIQGDIEKFLTYCTGYRLEELSEADVTESLMFLSKILYGHFNKKVVILIDDAEEPITNAMRVKMKDETLKYLIHLLRAMFSAGLKDNEFLERSLVSSAGRLSGVFFNNQYRALFLQNKHFSETFGFTRQEVHDLLENDVFQVVKDFDGIKNIKKWYNGYQILNKNEPTIYNSFSIIGHLEYSFEYHYKKSRRQRKIFHTFWARSRWLDIYLSEYFSLNHEIKEAIDKLVKGESISIVEAEPTVDNILELKRMISLLLDSKNKLNELQVNLFLQLLWDHGFLNAVEKNGNTVQVKIPNFEIKEKIEYNCYTKRFFEVNYRLKCDNIDRYTRALHELLRTASNNEQESGIEESMCNLVNAVSLLFSDNAVILFNESELHDILFYLAHNNPIFMPDVHGSVVKVSEELRDSAKLKGNYQSTRKEKCVRKNEYDMCVTRRTVAVLFEFQFLKNDEAENSKAALQQIIEKKYFTLDEEEYKHVKTKILVGLCVKSNSNVTAHYLVNDTDLDNAKHVSGCRNN